MDVIFPLVLILGGILAISSLIVAKKPAAKQYIDKLRPFQAAIGLVLLVLGLWYFFRYLSFLFHFIWLIAGVTAWGMIVSSILLGFIFGMPQIAKWIPGESPAEQKAMELSKKLVPYQTLLGIVGIVSALLALLIELKILTP